MDTKGVAIWQVHWLEGGGFVNVIKFSSLLSTQPIFGSSNKYSSEMQRAKNAIIVCNIQFFDDVFSGRGLSYQQWIRFILEQYIHVHMWTMKNIRILNYLFRALFMWVKNWRYLLISYNLGSAVRIGVLILNTQLPILNFRLNEWGSVLQA